MDPRGILVELERLQALSEVENGFPANRALSSGPIK